MKTRYRAVFISDLHLGSGDSHYEDILEFLSAVKCDYLYIVGDFIDLWSLKRKWNWPQIANNIVRKVLSKAKRGTKVFYVPGNHDEVFREFIDYLGPIGGVQIQSMAIHETKNLQMLMIVHGDDYDMVVKHRKLVALGNWAYDWLIWLNKVTNKIRHFFGLNRWSLSAAVKRNVKSVSSYVSDFETSLMKMADSNHMDGVVCGHIHSPVAKTVAGLKYFNCGDWVEHCTAIVENEDGTFEIVKWDFMSKKIVPWSG